MKKTWPFLAGGDSYMTPLRDPSYPRYEPAYGPACILSPFRD